MIGIILLAVGEVGVAPLLGPFLADQLREHGEGGSTENTNENQVMAQKRVWWRFAWCCGVAAAFYANNIRTWGKTFMFTLFMGGSLILLLLGTPFYHSRQIPPVDRFAIIQVVKTSLKKKHLNYPLSPEQFFSNDEGNVLRLSPRIKLLRWIDKAAIIETSSISKEQEEAGTLCTVAQLRESKYLFKLLPLWSSFIVFGLVLSAGNTFFPEQGAKMISERYLIFLLTFEAIIRATISYLSKKLISKFVPETKQRQAQVLRTFIGMVMSTVCCVVSWQVEVRRLEKSKQLENMSMFWLVPQFCLLGLMEGLALHGCDEYASSHFPERMEYHVSVISSFFVGILKAGDKMTTRASWSPPPSGWVKINVDAAINLEEHRVGLGIIIRDANKDVIAAAVKSTKLHSDVTFAEAEAMKWGLSVAVEKGLARVIVESDSQEAVDFVNNRKSSRTEIQWLVAEMQSSLKGFSAWKIQQTPRSCNVIDHSIAKLALEKCKTVVWVDSYPSEVMELFNSLNE